MCVWAEQRGHCTALHCILPFHGARVHLLFVVEKAVGCAGDGYRRVQAERLGGGQDQLGLQQQLIVLREIGGHSNTPSGFNTLLL